MKKIFGLFGAGRDDARDLLAPVDSVAGEDSGQVSTAPASQPAAESRSDAVPENVAESQAQAVAELGEQHELIAARFGQIGEILERLEDAHKLIRHLGKPLAATFRHHQNTASQNIALLHALDRTGGELAAVRERESAAVARSSSLELKLKHLQEAYAQAESMQHTMDEELRLLSGELRLRETEIIELERQRDILVTEIEEVRGDRDEANARWQESEIAHSALALQLRQAREDYQALEKEHESLQTSVQHTVTEAAQIGRRLAEAEEAAASSRARLLQVEAMLAEIQAEKVKLLEKINALELSISEERRSLGVKADGMRGRSATLEKLLTQTREELANQAEALREALRRGTEMTITINRLEARSEKAISDLKKSEEAQRLTEQARLALVDRVEMMGKSARAKEAALKRSNEVAENLAHRLEVAECKVATQAEISERQFAELSAAYEREKTERALLEGTLEAARQEKARLQRELVQYRSDQLEEFLSEAPHKVETAVPVVNAESMHAG